MQKIFKPTFSCLVLLAALGLTLSPAFAESDTKDSFFYFLEGEALGGYSKIVGSSGQTSTQDKWLVSPNWRLKENLYWINVYNGSYDRSSQVAAQEEGGRQTSTTQSHSLSTALKYAVSPTWSLRPIFFADWVFVNETNDESFGEGLYDYRDVGGGLESQWTLTKTNDKLSRSQAGFRFFERVYPNFQTLLSLIGGNTPEVNEKDFFGYKFNLGYDRFNRAGWSWGVEAITLLKDFADKRTIDLNGSRDPEDTRFDTLQYLNANASHAINKQFTFRLDGQISFNVSNLDFYDTHNTLGRGDDNFIENYFDYYGFTVRPTLMYARNIAKDKNFHASISYNFYAQYYTDRLVQNEVGVYQTEEEEDLFHTFSARTSWPITKNIAWVNTASYTIAESNQDFEAFYLYSYDLWNVLTGISLKY